MLVSGCQTLSVGAVAGAAFCWTRVCQRSVSRVTQNKDR